MKFSHALLLLIALISLMSNIPASAALNTLAVFVMYLQSYSVLAPFVKHPAFVQILRLIFIPTPTTPNINALPYSPSIILHLFAIVQACLKKSQILEYLLLGETFRRCQAVIEFALGSPRKLTIQLLQTIVPWVHAWIVRIVSYGLLLSDNLTCGAIRFILMVASPDNKVYLALFLYGPMGIIYTTTLWRKFSLMIEELGANRRGPVTPLMRLHSHLKITRMHCLADLALLSWAIVILALWDPYWEAAVVGVVMMANALCTKKALRVITPVTPFDALMEASIDYPRQYLSAILALRVAHARAIELGREARIHLALRRLADRGAIDLTRADPQLINAMTGPTHSVKIANAKNELRGMLGDYRRIAYYDRLVYQPGDAEARDRIEFRSGATMGGILVMTGGIPGVLPTH